MSNQNKVDKPLKDTVYVLTRHEARDDDSDKVGFEVLGVYNTKRFAHQQMLLDYERIKDEEPEMYDYENTGNFWDDELVTDATATLNQEAYPIYFHGDIKEMEIE